MLDLSDAVRPLFEAAGWIPGARSRAPTGSHAAAANPHAFEVLAEFGGLHVGACGPGRECAASDVQFWESPSWEASRLVRRWQAKLGPLAGIGSAHRDHIVLFVAEDGRFYLFTTSDRKRYRGGDGFCETMERLLLGTDRGDAL